MDELLLATAYLPWAVIHVRHAMGRMVRQIRINTKALAERRQSLRIDAP